METRRYSSKSGDYRHKSGDREIWLKIWSLPDEPRELTALLVPLMPIKYIIIDNLLWKRLQKSSCEGKKHYWLSLCAIKGLILRA